MRVYIAADSSLQTQMRHLRDGLTHLGHVVTSKWLDIPLEFAKGAQYTEEELEEWANKDLLDVHKAEILIAFNPVSCHRSGTGGRHVEFGFALARHIPIIYVGEKAENIFHRLASVVVKWDYNQADLVASLDTILKHYE